MGLRKGLRAIHAYPTEPWQQPVPWWTKARWYVLEPLGWAQHQYQTRRWSRWR